MGNLKIDEQGVRHSKLDNEMLRWDEVLYVDYRQVENSRGGDGQVLVFTLTPEAVVRLNKVLPIFRRFLLPSVFGNTLTIDITGEPLLDTSSAFTAGVQIFKAIEKHVPRRPRVAKSGIEGFAEGAIVAHSLTTAVNTQRSPREWKDGVALFLIATLAFVALLALIMLPAYFFLD